MSAQKGSISVLPCHYPRVTRLFLKSQRWGADLNLLCNETWLIKGITHEKETFNSVQFKRSKVRAGGRNQRSTLLSPTAQASRPLGCCSFPWSEASGRGHPAAFLTPFLSHFLLFPAFPSPDIHPDRFLLFKQTKNCVIWIQDGFLYKDNILNIRSCQGLKQLTILPLNICMLNTVDAAGFFFSRDNSIFLYCLCLSHPRGGSIFGCS